MKDEDMRPDDAGKAKPKRQNITDEIPMAKRTRFLVTRGSSVGSLMTLGDKVTQELLETVSRWLANWTVSISEVLIQHLLFTLTN